MSANQLQMEVKDQAALMEDFDKVLKKTLIPSKMRESLVDNEYLSDVEFILGEDEYETTVFAHKIFLVTASTRFHLIFKNQMENSKLLKIKIKNTSKPVMLEVLRFVYTDNAYFTDDNCLGVLEAAMNFDLKALVEKAVDYACKRVDEKTVFKIFEDNQELGNLKINMKCLDYIQTFPAKCFSNKEFENISHDLLRSILQTCRLAPADASKAAWRWAEASCKRNQRPTTTENKMEELDDLFHLLNMDSQESECFTENGSNILELNFDAQQKYNNGSDSDHSEVSKKSQRSAAGGAKKKVDRPRRQKDQRPPQQAGPGPQGRKGPFNNGPGNNFNQGNQGFVRFPGNFTPGQGYGPSHHQSPQQFGSPGNGPQFRGKKPPQQNNQQNFHQNNQNFQPNNQNFQPNNQNFEQARSSMDAPNSQAAKSLPVQRPPRNFQVDGVLQRKFYKEASLEMRTKKPIHLAELQFVYDLASTDSYFEIWITHVENKRRNDLFYERVNIAANKRDGEYLRMFFPKGKINLHPGKQIVIRIEFAQEEYRMTLDNCKVSMASARDALELCQSKELPQIISKIVYLD